MKIKYYEQQKVISGRTDASDEEREAANKVVAKLKNDMFRIQTKNKTILAQIPQY